jgi:hypothetical protein
MVQPVENDQMIGAFAPDRPDQAFNISVLPGNASVIWRANHSAVGLRVHRKPQ